MYLVLVCFISVDSCKFKFSSNFSVFYILTLMQRERDREKRQRGKSVHSYTIIFCGVDRSACSVRERSTSEETHIS